MTDVHSPEVRSKNMRAIRNRDTKPELLVRKALHAAGFRYRLGGCGLPGRPDLVFPKYRTVVFVNGCFWHQHIGCKLAAMPKTNTEFWHKKLQANVHRDSEVMEKLSSLGWRVLVIWECQRDASPLENLISGLRRLDPVPSVNGLPRGIRQANRCRGKP